MLDAFIIEEIKRRERMRQEKERPVVQIPLPDDRQERHSDTEDDESPQRGVVVIDL